jgi:serine/threonine-protein kinase
MVSTSNDLFHLGRYVESESSLRQAYAIQHDLLERDSPYFAETQDALGAVLLQERRYDEAEQAYTMARDIWIKRYGADYSYVIGVRSDLAWIALSRGDATQAEKDLRQVLVDRDAAHDTDTAIDQARLGEAERRNGEIEAALASERSALSNAIEIHGATSWESGLAERYLGLALADAAHPDEAEKNLRAAIAYYDGLVGDGDHPLAATTRLALGEVLASRPTGHTDAVAIVERAAQQRERMFGIDDARTKEARVLLGDLRAGKARPSKNTIAMADP